MNRECKFLASVEVDYTITLRDSYGRSMKIYNRRQFDSVRGYVASCVSSGEDAVWYKGNREVTIRIPKDKCKGLLDFLLEVETEVDGVKETIERTL